MTRTLTAALALAVPTIAERGDEDLTHRFCRDVGCRCAIDADQTRDGK